MRKVIKSSQNVDDLFDKLTRDLDEKFEDNIIIKYVDYYDPDRFDTKTQQAIYDRYVKARMAYLKAVEQLVKSVDVYNVDTAEVRR